MAAAIGAMLADLQPARRKDKRKAVGGMPANVQGGKQQPRKSGGTAKPRRKQRAFLTASELEADFDIDAAPAAAAEPIWAGATSSARGSATAAATARTDRRSGTAASKPLSNEEEALREVAVLRAGPILAVEVLRRLR